MKKHDAGKLVRNGGLFIILVILTFHILLRGQKPEELFGVLKQIQTPCLLIAVLCMVLYIFGEAKNIQIALSMFGDDITFSHCLRYSLTGFFFSSITPSASGGQPMQVLEMHHDGIPPSHSVLSLMTELAAFQIVSVLMAIAGFVFQRERLMQLHSGMRILMVVGVALNLLVLLAILVAIFSKRLAPALWNGLSGLLGRMKFRKAAQWKKKGDLQLAEYRACANRYAKQKGKAAAILLVSLLRLAAFQSVPYWIYRAFGLSAESWLTILSLQSVLFITVSSLPLPGAVGVSESGFLLLYRTLFSEGTLSGAMLLSRGVSFYLFVLISGAFYAVVVLRRSFVAPRTTIKQKQEQDARQDVDTSI